MRKGRKIKIILFLSLMIVLLMQSYPLKRFIANYSVATARTYNTTTTLGSHFMRKEFIYLVQAESCLPEYLAGPKLIGDASACRCDVLVFSYKNKCEKSFHDHVRYIHAPNSTWASGRNLLFRYSTARYYSYRYYIFADDDIKLEYNPLANKSLLKNAELRTFENFLLDIEPVVGFVDYTGHHAASTVIAMRKHCLNKPDMSLLPLVHFDPILNGFHRDAIFQILPYSEEYDSTCWWHSHRLVSIAIEMKFRGQAIMYPGIRVSNLLHRKYPRNDEHEIKVMKDAIEKEKGRAPQQYRGHFILEAYSLQPIPYSLGFSPTTCMKIVPHRPIKPYMHFKEFPMHNLKTIESFFNKSALSQDSKKT